MTKNKLNSRTTGLIIGVKEKVEHTEHVTTMYEAFREGGSWGNGRVQVGPVESAEELCRRPSGNVGISKKSRMTYYL